MPVGRSLTQSRKDAKMEQEGLGVFAPLRQNS
jgi:hypothetical protein